MSRLLKKEKRTSLQRVVVVCTHSLTITFTMGWHVDSHEDAIAKCVSRFYRLDSVR
jgi:hypothetical protein